MKKYKLFLFVLLSLIGILTIYLLQEPNGVQKVAAIFKPKIKTVGIQPFKGIKMTYVQEAKTAIDSFYHLETIILPSKNLPKSAYYAPRNRYRADTLIRYLRRTKPKRYDKILGLTHKDISTTKGKHKDWGSMGLGFRPGASCVVSTYRIRRGTHSKKHFQERFRKVVLHEVGHNLGLKHCNRHEKCLMKDAKGKVSTVDTANEWICKDCVQDISGLIRK